MTTVQVSTTTHTLTVEFKTFTVASPRQTVLVSFLHHFHPNGPHSAIEGGDIHLNQAAKDPLGQINFWDLSQAKLSAEFIHLGRTQGH